MLLLDEFLVEVCGGAGWWAVVQRGGLGRRAGPTKLLLQTLDEPARLAELGPLQTTWLLHSHSAMATTWDLQACQACQHSIACTPGPTLHHALSLACNEDRWIFAKS